MSALAKLPKSVTPPKLVLWPKLCLPAIILGLKGSSKVDGEIVMLLALEEANAPLGKCPPPPAIIRSADSGATDGDVKSEATSGRAAARDIPAPGSDNDDGAPGVDATDGAPTTSGVQDGDGRISDDSTSLDSPLIPTAHCGPIGRFTREGTTRSSGSVRGVDEEKGACRAASITFGTTFSIVLV
mmetsp:Transcript_93933/g.166219  ORF Transcript_93933/g.166219 Transcript_93933/m.166219 type:complete len:185 (+) Transcript_93933:233-787(+)